MRQRELESQGVKGRKLGERKEKRKLEGERERELREKERPIVIYMIDKVLLPKELFKA